MTWWGWDDGKEIWMLDVGLMGWIGLIVRVCCNFMIIGITLLGVGLIGGN